MPNAAIVLDGLTKSSIDFACSDPVCVSNASLFDNAPSSQLETSSVTCCLVRCLILATYLNTHMQSKVPSTAAKAFKI